MPLAFERALNFVLRVEGLYSNRRDDRGGPTCYGVAQRQYDANRRKHHLPLQPVIRIDKVECRYFYFTEYWLPAGCGELPECIALATFDAAVNHGPRRAVRLLQHAVGVTEDGLVGQETLHAVFLQDRWPLCRRLLFARARLYATLWLTDPTQRTFRRGWINRLRLLRHELRTIRVTLKSVAPSARTSSSGGRYG